MTVPDEDLVAVLINRILTGLPKAINHEQAMAIAEFLISSEVVTAQTLWPETTRCANSSIMAGAKKDSQ